MSLLQASLSLPGIAGIVLTVGMAADANVLIYERVREELRAGNTPQASINAGFDKAFSAIADSNVTTLDCRHRAVCFRYRPDQGIRRDADHRYPHFVVHRDHRQPRADPVDLGSAPQARGIAGLRQRPVRRAAIMEFFKTTPRIPFMEKRRWAYAISAIPDRRLARFACDPRAEFRHRFHRRRRRRSQLSLSVDLDKARDAVEAAGFRRSAGADRRQFPRDHGSRHARRRTRTSNQVAERIVAALKTMDPGAQLRRTDVVGPQVGEELAEQGGLAMLFTFIMILIYVGFRFEKKMAAGTVFAAMHDPFVILGFLLGHADDVRSVGAGRDAGRHRLFHQ